MPLFRKSIAGAVLVLSALCADAEENSGYTESVVIFNTICAKCHEAECSGRLSFDEAFEKSTQHIVRHYERAEGKRWLQKELFEILDYMKAKCAYYPMQGPVPMKRDWSGEVLDRFSTLLERNYFIPVGYISPGRYEIHLQLETDEKVTLQLISEHFDMPIEDCFSSHNKSIDVPFTIEEAGNYYFRMYPRNAVRLRHFSIKSFP